jgi:hypothetical protein
MATGQRIRAGDYNAIRVKVGNLLGDTGSGTVGYGQRLISNTVSPEVDIITRDQWNSLRKDILNIRLHQSNSVSGIATIPTTEPIRFGSSHPNTNFSDITDQLLVTRQSVGQNRSTLSLKATTQTFATWGSLATTQVTITFPGYNRAGDNLAISDVNHARYFFNSGGKFRLISTRSGGSSSAQNNSWSALLTQSGIIELGATTPVNLNFYNLTDQFQTLYQASASSPYASNIYRVEVRCNVANNQTATATQVFFRISWIDNYTDITPSTPPFDLVDGKLELKVEELKATGPIFNSSDGEIPTGSWFLPSPVYFADSISVSGSPLPEPVASPSTDICIAVIDECNRSATEMEVSWAGFKSRYPGRLFYLLQPNDTPEESLKIPPAFKTDFRAFGALPINRDNGNNALASDWFEICNLNTAAVGTKIFVSIDASGSLTLSQVRASYNLFAQQVSAAGLTLVVKTMSNENWITPFDTPA